MKTSISQPETPPQPSTADAVNAWVQSLPQVYQTQLEYAPKEAEQQIALASQYALPYAEAMKTVQDTLYPETAALQEQLAAQAQRGIEQGLTPQQEKLYRDRLTSELGTNVGSPIGADYVSQGLVQKEQDWQNYYRNLALSVAGRQPLTVGVTPQTTNYVGGFTPQGVMNYTSANYGNYANAYSNMYKANAQLTAKNNALMQGYANMGLGAAAGFML